MGVSNWKKKLQRQRRARHVHQAAADDEEEQMLLSQLMFLLFALAIQLSEDDLRASFGGNKRKELH